MVSFANQAVRVVWNPNPENDISYYRLHYGTDASSLSEQVDAVGTTVEIEGLQDNATYHFALRAVNTSGMVSGLSEVVSYHTGTPLATAPALVVLDGNGETLANDENTLAFGSLVVGGTHTTTLTITLANAGDADLVDVAASLTGASGDFTITRAPAGIVPAGGQTSVEITFDPLATGGRSAVLEISSNDPANGLFRISLAGTGNPPPVTAVPEIAVETSGGSGLVSGAATLDFGSVLPGASSTTTMLTVRNVGTADLTGLAIAVSGANSADFIVQSPVPSIAPGGATTLGITFRPSAVGSRYATLVISSNDADEGAFSIQLAGTGQAKPEISIERGGNPLVSGSATLGFGSVLPGTTSTASALTLRNSGSATLTGISAVVSGTHASDFLVQPTLPTSLAAGASTTFNVYFKPGAVGNRSAKLTITSNDADEGDFVIQLTGVGLAKPEIAITDEQSNDLVSGTGTLTFGSAAVRDGSRGMTFRIRNTGTGTLTGIAASLTGSHAADFSVSTAPAASLAPGAQTTVSLVFSPGAAGTRSAALRIASNDSDENPFVINLSGVGTVAPEIAVSDEQSKDLVSGTGTLTFGSAAVRDGSRGIILTVRNTGTAALTGIAASLSGSHAADFSVSTAPAASLAPGAQTTVALVFSPGAAGTRSAKLAIASNDADESSFVIHLGGVGTVAPQIEIVRIPGGKIPEGNGFGEVEVGDQSEGITYEIRNTGTGILSQLSLELDGDHPGDFTVTPLAAKLLAPGGSTEFTLTFRPPATGTRKAVLRVFSNDPENNPLELPVHGKGIAFPNIIVAGSNGSFGSARTGDKGAVRSFVIRNNGSAPLRTVRAGTGSAEFTIVKQPAAVIAAGAEDIVSVRFSPKAAGARKAVLRILSNDPDEGRISIPLVGNGIATPEIRVSAGRTKLVDGDAYVAFGSSEVGKKSKSRKIVITNRGTGPLTGLKVRKNWRNAGDFKVGRLKKTLEPGKSTTIKVTFKPKSNGNRWAQLHIASNDPDAPSFDIVLNGTGVKGDAKKKSAVRKTTAKSSKSKSGGKLVVHVDGRRYRAIKIRKSEKPDVRPRDIQVSGDLLDWSSGLSHTTVVKNNDKVLIVRDNTPLGEGKRHIRLNPRS
ncbi:MAG: choice-of-anchor D domain-containing protein [Akkermansiaceae bacterium]|nr:choice-of-anchor D domain-containing protein [Akkermansiaceae bacterium]